jgi:putative iron-only hydrogenase system regulator
MEMTMEQRIGFVGIIIENRDCVERVNNLISESADIILARVGLPQRDRGVSVITLVVEATTDQVGLLTGRLGAVKGVSVKSGLAKPVHAMED